MTETRLELKLFRGDRMRKIVNHLKKSDAVMGGIVDAVGPYKMTQLDPTFASLARSITFQQLSGKVARVIYGRLEEAVKAHGMTPEGILSLRPQRMRKVGLSKQKTEYLRDLARSTRDGVVVFEDLPRMADDDVIACLTKVKGIGVWTAQMFLMFALGRQDIMAAGDLGIQTALRKAYGLETLPKPAVVEEMGVKWKPYRTAACWYLWRSLETKPGADAGDL